MGAGEDADFDGSAFDFLLNGPFDWVRGAHFQTVMLGKAEHGEAFGDKIAGGVP